MPTTTSVRVSASVRVSVALFAITLLTGGPARAERRLTLAEAVSLALGTDPTVAQARIGNDRARLAVLRAQLDRVTVSVDGAMSELWNKTNIGGDPLTATVCVIGGATVSLPEPLCTQAGGQPSTFEIGTSGWQGLSNLSASVTAPLFSGFRVSSNVAASQRQEEASQALIRQARRDVALSVARAYWSIRRLELGRDVVAAAVVRLKESEGVAEARLGAGLSPPIDKNRALQQRLAQESQVADLGGQVREQSAQLAAALNVDDDIVLTEPIDPIDASEERPPSTEELVASAVKGRPELARAELAYATQEQIVRIVRSEYFPQLSATGLLQFGNNQFNTGSGARSVSSSANPFSSFTGSVTVGLQLRWNFFNMLNTYTREKDARFELARLAEEIRLQRRQVTIDVRVARAKLDRLYAQRTPLGASLALARDNVLIIEGRYKNGDALVSELIQSQVDLTTAERQFADLSAQIRLAWLELSAALGQTVGSSQ